MHGLILLDGPDCAGKSTLAQSIVKAAQEKGQRAVIHHLGKPEVGQCWKLHSEAICKYVTQMIEDDCIVVADRHFLSEEIYGKVYRNGGEYSYAMRFVDMLYNRVAGLRVICCPPTNVVVDTHKKMKEERHEEYDSGMDRIANLYLGLWHSAVHSSSLPGRDYTGQLAALGGVQDVRGWYHFDYTENDVDDYARYLLEEVAIEQALNQHLPSLRDVQFNGAPSLNGYLLVADQMSSANGLGLPFFANHGSSWFLGKTLHELMIPAEKLCIVNINDDQGVKAANDLAQLCGKVIVLGREAQRTMLKYGIEYDEYVRHPQHARRFNHNDNTYKQELAKALGV